MKKSPDKVRTLLGASCLLFTSLFIAACCAGCARGATGFLPASQDYVNEVAEETRASAAEGNPISATFQWAAAVLAALTGTGYMSRKRRTSLGANVERAAKLREAEAAAQAITKTDTPA